MLDEDQSHAIKLSLHLTAQGSHPGRRGHKCGTLSPALKAQDRTGPPRQPLHPQKGEVSTFAP